MKLDVTIETKELTENRCHKFLPEFMLKAMPSGNTEDPTCQILLQFVIA